MENNQQRLESHPQPSKNKRPKGITFRGIVAEPDEKFIAIAYPQKPKDSSKSPFLGLVYGAIKNVKDSFETGEYDLPIQHKFKDWDRIVITIKSRLYPPINVLRDDAISYPIVVIQAGNKWISGIFPLKKGEESGEDFSYDLPIDHPFKALDELVVIIKRSK